MIPSQQQKQILRDSLRKMLNYRETYEEVYDHILSALTNEPDNITMNDAISKLIRTDFGGYKRLKRMEKTIKRTAIKDTVKQYLNLVADYFKIPFLFYTIALIVTACYFISLLKINTFAWHVLFLGPLIVVGIIIHARYIKTGYVLGDSKQSARDRIFRNIALFPVRMYAIFYFPAIFYQWNYNPLIANIAFIVFNMHVITIIRLYNYEFKKLIVSQ